MHPGTGPLMTEGRGKFASGRKGAYRLVHRVALLVRFLVKVKKWAVELKPTARNPQNGLLPSLFASLFVCL